MLRVGIVYAIHALELQKGPSISIKVCLMETRLRRKCYGLHKANCEVHMFRKKCVRIFIGETVKSRRVVSFLTYFESKQFVEVILTIKKHAHICDDEITFVIDIYQEYIAIKEEKNHTMFLGDRTEYRKFCKKKRNRKFIN